MVHSITIYIFECSKVMRLAYALIQMFLSDLFSFSDSSIWPYTELEVIITFEKEQT